MMNRNFLFMLISVSGCFPVEMDKGGDTGLCADSGGCETGNPDDSAPPDDTSTPEDCAEGTISDAFSMPYMVDTEDLTTHAEDVPVSITDGVATLVTATTFQAGDLYFGERLPLGESFNTSFSFVISSPGGIKDPAGKSGGDGLALILHNEDDKVGGDGGGLGYSGIDSVAVEFDTWLDVGLDDPTTQHVGIMVGGDNTHGSGENPDAGTDLSTVGDIEGDVPVYAWVDYDGVTMSVYVSLESSKPATPLVTRAVDVQAEIGGSLGYIGFSAATGEAYEDIALMSWTFEGTGCL